ncbi:hypothetical protein J6590_088162 [Homalodisca vitripennis]|nr:hypothetical protein J6590_088162 [Homalodisca vitripennis]
MECSNLGVYSSEIAAIAVGSSNSDECTATVLNKGSPNPCQADHTQQASQQKTMCHLNMGNLIHVQERHITNRKCRDSGMTVGVGGVCSLTSEVLLSLNKVPPLLPGRCSALILSHES